MDKKEWSEFVSKARAKADMTQWEFADELKISWITVWRWENEFNMPKTDAIDYWKKEISKI